MGKLGGPKTKHCSRGQEEDAAFPSSVSPWFLLFHWPVLRNSKIDPGAMAVNKTVTLWVPIVFRKQNPSRLINDAKFVF